MSLFSSSEFIEKTCPNGETVNILKDPEHSFSILTTNWKVTVESTIDKIGKILGLGLEKQKDTIVKGLTENYAESVLDYKVAYMIFHCKPCSEIGYEEFMKASAEIRKRHDDLMTMQNKAEDMLQKQTVAAIPPLFKEEEHLAEPQGVLRPEEYSMAETPSDHPSSSKIGYKGQIPVSLNDTKIFAEEMEKLAWPSK